MPINENTLEQVIIEELKHKGYEYIYGPDIDRDYHEVILFEYYKRSMAVINPGIKENFIDESYKTIKNLGMLQLVDKNADFHKYLIEGVPVPYQENGENRTYTVKLVDFDNPENNDFKAINQYTIIEYKTKRPDIIVFINGIPMVVFELKNIAKENTTVENAYQQIKNYQLDIPTLFQYNAFNIISDGIDTKLGTITSDYSRYMAWKSENGEKPESNSINFFTTMLNGVFPKERILDIIRNFTLFKNADGHTIKVIAGYHQYFAVKKAVESTQKSIDEKTHKAGVVWHTQGSGKSFSMVFYAGLVVSNPVFDNPTLVVLTDRNDLDNQLFETFASCSKLLLRQTPKHAESREHLKELLDVKAGGIIFTTIQKFAEGTGVINERSNIIFMTDEAHRSQYGFEATLDTEKGNWKYGIAKYMRDALPNATFIGFTGTPINLKDRSTVEVFGDYIDVYDMTQAVDDGATVPIYYENRTTKLKINDEILQQIDYMYSKMESETDSWLIEKSQSDLSRLESVVGSYQRLNMLADDIIKHYSDREFVLTGKAMIVCLSRKIAIKMYEILLQKKPEWKDKMHVILTSSNQDPEEWHDIIGNKQSREQLAIEFKKEDSDFKIAIVVDMWLTGFDVPSMATMYIDKPMKGHNLMQAIARVNRVYKDKEAGLVVDYIGMASELKQALSQYTKRDQDKVPDINLAYSICLAKLETMRDFFYGFNYENFFGTSDKERLQTLKDGIDYALSFTEEEQTQFVTEATALGQAETLCRSMLDLKDKQEIEFFKGVKAGLCKLGGRGKLTVNEINARIIPLLEQAIEQGEMFNIFAKTGQKNPEISVLSDEYMKHIRQMKHKNIAAEILQKLLDDNITVFSKTNLVKSKAFSERFNDVMRRYNNNMITSTEVIEELLELAKQVKDEYEAGNDKGLTQEELAFYDALVSDPDVLLNMEEPILVDLAHELTDLIRKTRTVDWDKKESVRAYMRTQVKHLLRKYKYPPEKVKGAIDVVIKQAELMSANIVL